LSGGLNLQGLYVSTLMDGARNPALVLMYGLVPKCKEYGVNVEKFKIDKGRMVNQYRVSYCDLADYYCRGLLPKRYLKNQNDIRSLNDVKNEIFGVKTRYSD
jgi:hypothetical protein